MSIYQNPASSCQIIERMLVDAGAEIDALGFVVSGARLQHALDTFRSEWAEALEVSDKAQTRI